MDKIKLHIILTLHYGKSVIDVKHGWEGTCTIYFYDKTFEATSWDEVCIIILNYTRIKQRI